MKLYYTDSLCTLYHGDSRELPMEDGTVQTCITSPPYFGLRDYQIDGQIGLEPTPDEYVASMVGVFREVHRVMKDDGTLWLNLGDSYANDGKWGGSSGGKHVTALHGNTGIGRGKRDTGLKSKDLIGIPWRVAFALQVDGWHLRQDIIWAKPNPMPESVTDRCTKSHEYIFLLSKSDRYFFDADAMQEPSVTNDIRRPYGSEGAWELDGRSAETRPNGKPRGKGGVNAFRGQGHFRKSDSGPANRDGREMADIGAGLTRNRRSVWTVATAPYPGAHFATFPPALIEPCILAGSRRGDVVLDNFSGTATTGAVARQHGRKYIGVELNEEYLKLSHDRFAGELFRTVAAAQ